MKKKCGCNYYDDPEFDYWDYWIGREYEDLAERQVLDFLYKKIGKKNLLIDVGGGYGRLVRVYKKWVKKAILIDSSVKNLKEAEVESKRWKNLRLVKGTAEKLPVDTGSVDVMQMIRVAHHCLDLKKVFKEGYRVLKPGGWFVLEFPNKIHALMTLRMWMKGDFGFRSNLDSLDRRAQENRSAETISFMNHHPEQVLDWLKISGFEAKEVMSVSNLRRLNFIPLSVSLCLDRLMWGMVRPVWWGPSVFVLARKR